MSTPRGLSLLIFTVFCVGWQSPASASFEDSRSWFLKLSRGEQVWVQGSLTLLGYYKSAFVDGLFGRATYAAILNYEKSTRLSADGVLSPSETKALLATGDQIYAELGFELIEDPDAGAQLMLPTTLMPRQAEARWGNLYASEDGSVSIETIRRPLSELSFQDLHASLVRKTQGRTVEFDSYGPQQFGVGGVAGGRTYRSIFYNTGSDSVGFQMSWVGLDEEKANALALYMASYFSPLVLRKDDPPAEPSPNSAPEPLIASQPELSTDVRIGAFIVSKDHPSLIRLEGEITSATPLEFLRALKATPAAERVALNSKGGLVDSALVIAHEVRDRGLATVVPSNASCFSACAFIYFAGGEHRSDGALGVHQIWNESNDLVSGQAKLSDVLEAMTEFGVPVDVVSRMLRTPPTEMYVFTADEIAALGINAVPNAALESTSPLSTERPRALLLEASEDGVTGATPFTGAAEWRRGVDQTGQATIAMTAQIPGRNLGLELVIRKNLDTSLEGSVIIDIVFNVPAAFVGGAIAGLPAVLLKDEELVQGKPLVAASTRTAGNQFRLLLSDDAQGAEANRHLLATQKWMDVAVIYATGKRAIITLGKDALAERLFQDVLLEWTR